MLATESRHDLPRGISVGSSETVDGVKALATAGVTVPILITAAAPSDASSGGASAFVHGLTSQLLSLALAANASFTQVRF